MSPLNVPPELKRIKPFIQRAEELDRDKSPESRVVAYYCRQWAVQSGIPLSSSSPAAKACLGELLGQLEGEKQAMSVFNRAESKQICRGFADKIFDKANMVDRAGAADKSTARTFYAAATFFEILQQFDDETSDAEVTKEEEERRVYAKWKATEILKAIREGRKPAPGAYGEDMDEDKTIDKEVEEGGTQAGGAEVGDAGSPGADEEDEAEANAFVPPSAPATGFAPSSPPPRAPEPEPEPEPKSEPEEEGTEVGLHSPPPPAYPGNDDEDDGDVFVPGAVKSAAASVNRPPMAFDAPPPVVPPVIPVKAPAPAPATAQKSSKWGFGKKKASNVSVSKQAMEDAKELTRFALAALESKDPDLAAQRMQQALSALGR